MSTDSVVSAAVSEQFSLEIQEQRSAWALKISEQIVKTVPAGMTKDRFAAMVLSTFGRDKTGALARCNGKSLALAFLKCGQMGFYPGDPRNLVALVPYKGECTVIIQYQGLAELVRRHPDVKSINVVPLFKGTYRIRWTDDGYALDIDIDLSSMPNPGDITRETAPQMLDGFYAILTTTRGGRFAEVISLDEIEYRRKKGASGRGAKTPWDDFYLQMARKTALRKLLSGGLVPLSLEAAEAMADDADYEVLADDADQTPKPATKPRAAAKKPVWANEAPALPDGGDIAQGEIVDEPAETVKSGSDGDV